MEKVEILSWRDGCVLGTRSLGCGWFPSEEIDGNKPAQTGIMYVAASNDFARDNPTVRRALA